MELIVKYIAKVDVATGQIQSIGFAPGHIPPEGIADGIETIHLRTEDWRNYDNTLTIHEEFYRKEGAWVHRGAPPTKYYEWNIQEEEWQQNWNTFLAELREERNHRLHMCDWTQTLDNPMEETVKASWRNYRNSLRNFPIHFQTPDPTIRSLEDIECPALPDGTILEILVF